MSAVFLSFLFLSFFLSSLCLSFFWLLPFLFPVISQRHSSPGHVMNRISCLTAVSTSTELFLPYRLVNRFCGKEGISTGLACRFSLFELNFPCSNYIAIDSEFRGLFAIQRTGWPAPHLLDFLALLITRTVFCYFKRGVVGQASWLVVSIHS